MRRRVFQRRERRSRGEGSERRMRRIYGEDEEEESREEKPIGYLRREQSRPQSRADSSDEENAHQPGYKAQRRM